MNSRKSKGRPILLMLSLLFGLSMLSGCIESSFQLSKGSRLPVWFTPPPGMTRSDLSVTLNYYSKTLGDDTKLILKDKNGKVLKTVRGNEVPLTAPGAYPAYNSLTVDGQTEVLERSQSFTSLTTRLSGIKPNTKASHGKAGQNF